MTIKDDMVGRRFGKLEVLGFSHVLEGRSYWLCKCDCGEKSAFRRDLLLRQHSTSCGCKRRAMALEKAKILKTRNRKVKSSQQIAAADLEACWPVLYNLKK